MSAASPETRPIVSNELWRDGSLSSASMCTVGLLTISDRVSRGEAFDKSGPALRRAILEAKMPVAIVQEAVVPDEKEEIQAVLRAWSDDLGLRLVLTTGGTGFSPRDVTPEATEELISKRAPGLVVAMIKSSLDITPHAMLSRPAAGIRNSTLIINLPGSSKGSVENLQAVLVCLPHAIKQINGVPEDHAPLSAK